MEAEGDGKRDKRGRAHFCSSYVVTMVSHLLKIFRTKTERYTEQREWYREQREWYRHRVKTTVRQQEEHVRHAD